MIGAADIALAHALADAAGAVARHYFRRRIRIEDKPDHTPVTAADREAEAAMRDLIAKRFPADGILGEEFGASHADASRVWVLDPIDGTKSFIAGIPLFGILIALVVEGAPVLGVIDQPILRERWVGATGEPTRINGEAIRTRACGDLAQAVLYATAPEMFRAEGPAFARLQGAVKATRFGADCYAYGQLSAGFIDLVVEADLKPYDYCALAPVVEGAGGVITDWDGKRLTLQSDGRIVAAGDPALAAAARGVLLRA